MITVGVSKEQIKRAEKLYPFKNLNGSITHGESNIFGAIGEIIITDYFGRDVSSTVSTYDYDLIIKGYTVDVKTKKTTVTPMPHFLCSISAFNIKQECDYYMFTRVLTSLNKAFILGYIKKEEFFEQAEFKNKGELDVNGFVFKDNCYNLEVRKLNKIKNRKY